MGTTMKETIFADKVVIGLKNWHLMAKRSLSFKESNNRDNTPSTPSLSHSISTNSLQPLMSSPRATGKSSLWTHSPSQSSTHSLQTLFPPSLSPLNLSSRLDGREGEGSSSSSRVKASNGGRRVFEMPTRRRELEEIQRVTEEMMGTSGSRGRIEGGEMSFRMWWKKEMIEPIGARRSSS